MNRLACIIPFYKRHDLTDLCFKAIKKQSDKFNFDVYTSGSEGYKSKELAEKYQLNYLEAENNPLGSKNNKLIKETKNINYDGVFILGSDNFVNDAIIANLLTLDLKGKKVYGYSDIHFYDTSERKLGTKGSYNAKNRTIGVARLFSRELLEALNYQVWPGNLNSGLDSASMMRIRLHTREIKTEYENKYFMLDVKHSINITNPAIVRTCEIMEDLGLIEMHLKEIGKEILNLNPSNEPRIIINPKIMATKKFIKFLKEHPAGIPKGRIVKVDSKNFRKFINDEFAKESNEKEFQEYNLKTIKDSKEVSKKKIEAAEDIEKKKEIKLNQKLYRAIDELDLEANDSLSEQGIKEGTMVEVDAKANIVFNEAGEVNLKDAAKKEAPKKKKAKNK